jgi:uncharacterized protein (DUF1778 family)
MSRVAQRQGRLTLSLSPLSKCTLERAAVYLNKTVADFVIDVDLLQAEQVVSAHDPIVLTSAEWTRFQTMLLDPPEPNERLQQALDEHARIVRP